MIVLNLKWTSQGDKANHLGTGFFGRLMSDPHMQQLFKERWQWFKTEKMELLKDYVVSYAEAIAPALADDYAVWGPRSASSNPQTNLQRMLDWLDARVAYMDGL